jgi:hypothetical protein
MTATIETLTMHHRAFTAHAARFEAEANEIATEIETTLDSPHTYREARGLVSKRQRVIYLRHLADEARHQVEHCKKQLQQKEDPNVAPNPTHD